MSSLDVIFKIPPVQRGPCPSIVGSIGTKHRVQSPLERWPSMITMNRPIQTGSRPYESLLHNQTRNSDPKQETSQGSSLPLKHIWPSLQGQQNCPPSGGADTPVCWCCPSSTPASARALLPASAVLCPDKIASPST